MATLNAIYGLFSGPTAAERGFNALRSAGIPDEKFLVISAEPFEEYEFSHLDGKTRMPWIAVLGGVIGGTSGFLLAWYTQVAYPIPLITGGMPLVAPFPTGIVTYELTMMGAVVATLITLAVSAGLPNWKEQFYDSAVSQGKVVIGVADPSDAARADIEARLKRAGAESVKGTGRFAGT